MRPPKITFFSWAAKWTPIPEILRHLYDFTHYSFFHFHKKLAQTVNGLEIAQETKSVKSVPVSLSQLLTFDIQHHAIMLGREEFILTNADRNPVTF